MGKWIRGGHFCRDRIRAFGLVAGRGLWGKGWGWGGGGALRWKRGGYCGEEDERRGLRGNG